MEYRHLGRAGVRVSTISLGSWLTYGASVGEDAAAACIRTGARLLVTTFPGAVVAVASSVLPIARTTAGASV